MEKKKRAAMMSMSETMKELLPYTQLGWQLVAVLMLFFGGGYALDSWLGTNYVFTVVLSMIGVVLGLISVIKTALELEQKRKSKER